MSGTQDNSALYSQALQAVDGLCDTCASARNPDGNYFTVKLPVSRAVGGGGDRRTQLFAEGDRGGAPVV